MKESKEARRKRLHARNMRFYRSLESPHTPKEIKKMARNADSSERSVLFESWLQSSESWAKSTLVVRLRNRNSSTRRGLRSWLFRADMIQKWGQTVADMMIEAKLADPDRREAEVRFHPDLPRDKESKQFLVLTDDTAEDVEAEELERLFEGKEDSSSTSSTSHEHHDKKKKKKRRRIRSRRKRRSRTRPHPRSRKRRPKVKQRRRLLLLTRWGGMKFVSFSELINYKHALNPIYPIHP
ncbi:PLCXD2 [Symbiodinium necroappetens]|uniref:PLCXD2 protein n=1 Tax=Symbiodinium necroappetens TaxID=1628268 RepID=A0A813CLD8_9DINO|nr:PLCXD2 [Symbiodinium necroappetens]